MGQYHFGLGTGRIPASVYKIAERIAAAHDAELTAITEPGCGCGHGCGNRPCPARARYWFSCANLGAPFDSATARAVAADLAAVGLDIHALSTRAIRRVVRVGTRAQRNRGE